MGKLLVLLFNLVLVMGLGIVSWTFVKRLFNAAVDRKVEAKLAERLKVRIDPELVAQLKKDTLNDISMDEMLEEISKRRSNDLLK
jgi:hypothetical protein